MLVKSKPVKLLLILIIFTLLNINSLGSVSSTPTSLSKTQEDRDDAVQAGFDYISTQINEDGGIRWTDESSSVAASLRVVIALAANALPQDRIISASGNRPIDFLMKNGIDWVYQQESESPSFSPARAGQLLTAIAAANENPQEFGNSSIDLIFELKASYDTTIGIFGNAPTNNVIDQVWAMLGLAANHFGIPEEASLWLAGVQLDDGSWDDGYGSFLDTTPLAILALTAAGWPMESAGIQSALQYINDNQQGEGGWQTQWDSTTNPDTTGIILQSLTATGLEHDPQWSIENKTPQSALLEIQQEDGSFGADFSNAFSTADALIGLSAQPLFQLGTLKRVSDGFDYLVSAQDQNGGWGSPGQTIDSMLAFAVSGWDPNTILVDSATPEEFLIQNLQEFLSSGPDAVGKMILASVISGKDPTNFGGVDLIQTLQDAFDPELYAYGDPQNTWHQSFALLGLSAAKQEIPEGSVETLINLQHSNGGWSYNAELDTSPDTTALVIQSLMASGMPNDHESIQNAANFLRKEQYGDGGWGDSSTTGYVIMAINALGQSMGDWVKENGKTPIHDLFTYQNLNGAFYFNPDYPDDSLMSTTTALIALSGQSTIVEPTKYVSENRAGVLVLPEGETAHAVCASFTQPKITGLELLDISGIPYEAQDGFMSSILGISNPEGGTLYWSYWHWNGREWVFNTSGAGDSEVFPGSLEAWFLTSWELFPSPPPRSIPDLDKMCGAEVLKNYSVQPYLNYYELDIRQEIVSSAGERTETEIFENTQEAQVSPTDLDEAPALAEPIIPDNVDQEPVRSLVPIFIIAAVGLSMLFVIILILKKQK